MKAFLQTHTSEQQHELELKVSDLYQDLHDFDEADREEMLLLLRDKHARYLQVCSTTGPDSAPSPVSPPECTPRQQEASISTSYLLFQYVFSNLLYICTVPSCKVRGHSSRVLSRYVVLDSGPAQHIT